MFCHRCTRLIPTFDGYCSQEHADADATALQNDIDRAASCWAQGWAPWVDAQWRREIRRHLALWDEAAETDANARLIADAPRMLDALARAEQTIRNLALCGALEGDYKEIAINESFNLSADIAHAKGEAE